MADFGMTTSGQNDAIGKAQREIDDVRGIMTENIERVLERGERLDLLIDKTDRLGGSARDFRFRSKGLRRRMWWKNVKLMVLLTVVVVFLIYLFVGFGCGLPSMWFRDFRDRVGSFSKKVLISAFRLVEMSTSLTYWSLRLMYITNATTPTMSASRPVFNIDPQITS